MLKKPSLLLSINDNNKLLLSDINNINQKILSNENFSESLKLTQKDLNCFNLILKLTDNNTYSMIDFIIKNSHKKYNKKNFEGKEGTKYFILKQIFILFIYLSKQKQENPSQNEIYEDIYKVLLKIYHSLDFINNNDIFEIIRFNVILILDNLYNKYNIFLISIKFLIDFYKDIINNQKNDTDIIYDSITKFLEIIYKRLMSNRNDLILLQRYDDINDLVLLEISIFYNKSKDTRLNNIIDNILLLVYAYNYSELINENILGSIKEGFFELKKGSDIKIKNIIDLLNNKIHLVNRIYQNEKNSIEKDLYFPKNYFVFYESPESGIDYNTEFDLINYNFILIFSFKCSKRKDINNYPLITFLTDDNFENNNNNNDNILINLSIQNNHLSILYQNEYYELSDYEIVNDKTYLISIEFYKNKNSKDKVKLTINNEELRKGMNFEQITYKNKVKINLGYINEKIKSKYEKLKNISNNYDGIIGPVLFLIDYNENPESTSTYKLLEENGIIISSIYKLNNFYDCFMLMNNNFDTKNLFLYENSLNNIKTQNIQFINEGKKEYFIISPLSMINSLCNNTNIFINDFNTLENIETFYQTFEVPSKHNKATNAKMCLNTIQCFMKNDGMHLLILIMEYYYNILKMIIEYTDYADYENKLSFASEINKAIIPIFDLITQIIIFFNIDEFKDDLDSFGFTLMKTLNLLGDIHHLKPELVQCLIDNINSLLKFSKEKKELNAKNYKVIIDFLNKLFYLICNTKYFDISNQKQIKNIFKIFHEILLNNNALMNNDTLYSLIRFSFIFVNENNNEKKNQEYKLMSKEYKLLIELLINQNQSIAFYKEFLNHFLQRNLQIKEKYKLLKIFYKVNKIKSLIYIKDNSSIDNLDKSDITNEEGDKNNKGSKNSDKKRKLSDKSKKKQEKNKKDTQEIKAYYLDINTCKELIDIYDNILNKFSLMKSKNSSTNIKYIELAKSILIQLIFEQSALIIEEYPENKYYFFSKNNIKITKEKNEKKEIRQKTDNVVMEKDSKLNIKNFDGEENKDKNIVPDDLNKENNIKYLFDKLLKANNISFYLIKSLFSCLFDEWEKENKFKFIKDDKNVQFEKCSSIFGDFDKYKKELFSQILEVFDLVKDRDEKKNTLNLIFHFLVHSIEEFKIIEAKFKIPSKETKVYKKKFLHLFESKFLINKIFDLYLLNQNIISDTSFLKNIINICNNSLEYHPKPFVFSFLKLLIKNQSVNLNFGIIFEGIIDYISNSLKIDSDIISKEKEREEIILKKCNLIKDNDLERGCVNSYLYFNEIRLIKCLFKIIKIYPNEFYKILKEENFKFLFDLQKLIFGFIQSRLIYNTYLYIYHPNSLENISQNETDLISSHDKKNKEKNIVKYLQSAHAKLLSNQVLFLDILELSLLILYNLWTISCDDNQINKNEILLSFIKPILEKMDVEGHFICFYLDVFNSKNCDKIMDKLYVNKSLALNKLKEIPMKYNHWEQKNIVTEDNRLFTALSYIILMKYESLMINHENLKEIDNVLKKNIFVIFESNFNLFENDLREITKFYTKKKDKKTEIILEKEELNNKEFRTQKNYYKLLMNFLSKIKNLNKENFESFRKDLEKKYIKEEEEKTKNLVKENDTNILTDFIKLRKDSFHKYFEEENDEDIDYDVIYNNSKFDNEFVNITIINNIPVITNNSLNKITLLDFLYVKTPILCTKRDLILKKFGYYFFDEYFKDSRFIKMKNYFLNLYPPNKPQNSYNNYEKQMELEYPSILKNFSNGINYLPRLFLRPDHNFFKNKNIFKSHNYLKDNNTEKESDNKIYNYIIKEDTNKIMHFEYSHGFLNQDNFNLFTVGSSKENFSSSTKYTECEYINNKNFIPGKIKIIRNWMIFQTNTIFDYSIYSQKFKYKITSRKDDINQREKQIIIPLNLIEQIIYRNFLFYNQALEIFLFNGKSYFFNFYDSLYLDNFVKNLKTQYEFWNINIPEIIKDPIEYFLNKNYTNDWKENKISTMKYLLLINKFAGRTYNDLTQYLIFPWVLNDYTDIKNKNNYRKMQYSMAIQDDENLDQVKKDFEKDIDSQDKSHFVYHYSNSANVCLYLLRINPFTYNQIKLNGQFDSPQRQIETLQDMCYILKEFKETKELIPEYFFMVESFLNLNFNYFGKKLVDSTNEKYLLNNIKLSNDFTSLLELILFHKHLLNSDEVGKNINQWIDNIFGENQITTKKDVINSYPVGCYSKYVKQEVDTIISDINNCNPNSEDYNSKVKKALKEIKQKTDHAYCFGQCPSQIFQKAHPEKITKKPEIECDVGDFSEINISNKNEILYLDCKKENSKIFILTKSEILIYDKSLKFIQSFKIKILISMFSSINKTNETKLFDKFIYKNIIFEIEDCKIFFIGGYLDNSLKIYYLDNNNNTSMYNLSIITESRITCVKNIYNKNNMFLTGHLNGKIIKWKYELKNKNISENDNNNTSACITISKLSSIIGHKSFVQNLEINEDLNIIVSASNDGIILIRKLYDFELLNVIRYNDIEFRLLDLNIDNQIIITTYYNKKEKIDPLKKIQINTYSVNGIELGKMNKNIRIPLIIINSDDKLLALINNSFYEVFVTFKEWELVLDLSKDIDQKEENGEIISLGYDQDKKVVFCLFENKKLMKVKVPE